MARIAKRERGDHREAEGAVRDPDAEHAGPEQQIERRSQIKGQGAVIDLDQHRKDVQDEISGNERDRRVLRRRDEPQHEIVGIDGVEIERGQIELAERTPGEQQRRRQREQIGELRRMEPARDSCDRRKRESLRRP